MKGKTYDQAKQQFEAMWAGASDAVKEKYAGRSNSDLAPSEVAANRRLIEGIQPTPAGGAKPDMSTAGVHKRRMASYGHEFNKDGVAVPITPKVANPAPPAYDKDKNGIPDMIQRPAEKTAPTAVASNNQSNKSYAPGSDEARAAALTENSLNERYATADNGGGVSDAAAVAASKQFVPFDMSKIKLDPKDADLVLSRKVGAGGRQEAESLNSDFHNVTDRNIPKLNLNQPSPPDQSPVATPSVSTQPIVKTPIEERLRRSQAGHAKEIADAGGDLTKMPTDARMIADGKYNGGPTPVVKAPTQTPAITPPSVSVPRVNGLRPAPDFASGPGKELTGMSSGRPTYTNADDLYGKAKPDIGQTIKDTPSTADPTKPVMLASQGMDARRADYESRNQPASKPSLIPALTKPDPAAAPPRDPVVEDATPDSIAQAKVHNMSDEELQRVAGRTYGSAPNVDAPGTTSRVVSQRVATPEELRTGKVSRKVGDGFGQPASGFSLAGR